MDLKLVIFWGAIFLSFCKKNILEEKYFVINLLFFYFKKLAKKNFLELIIATNLTT